MDMIIGAVIGIIAERILHIVDKLFGWISRTSDRN